MNVRGLDIPGKTDQPIGPQQKRHKELGRTEGKHLAFKLFDSARDFGIRSTVSLGNREIAHREHQKRHPYTGDKGVSDERHRDQLQHSRQIKGRGQKDHPQKDEGRQLLLNADETGRQDHHGQDGEGHAPDHHPQDRFAAADKAVKDRTPHMGCEDAQQRQDRQKIPQIIAEAAVPLPDHEWQGPEQDGDRHNDDTPLFLDGHRPRPGRGHNAQPRQALKQGGLAQSKEQDGAVRLLGHLRARITDGRDVQEQDVETAKVGKPEITQIREGRRTQDKKGRHGNQGIVSALPCRHISARKTEKADRADDTRSDQIAGRSQRISILRAVGKRVDQTEFRPVAQKQDAQARRHAREAPKARLKGFAGIQNDDDGNDRHNQECIDTEQNADTNDKPGCQGVEDMRAAYAVQGPEREQKRRGDGQHAPAVGPDAEGVFEGERAEHEKKHG